MSAVKVLHSICQQIWKTQQWPQAWKRSFFISIPKKGNAKECSNYCTIALISQRVGHNWGTELNWHLQVTSLNFPATSKNVFWCQEYSLLNTQWSSFLNPFQLQNNSVFSKWDFYFHLPAPSPPLHSGLLLCPVMCSLITNWAGHMDMISWMLFQFNKHILNT